MRWLPSLISPGRIILVASLVAAGYLAFSAGNNLLNSYRLANDESQLRETVAELQRQEDQLLQIRDYLRTDEYVEFMARKVFGLVKPGETLVVIDAPEPVIEEFEAGSKWWERLFSP